MNDYLVTLTPVNKFFFGGDMTFQVGDNENDTFNEQYSSYLIESNRFPQQTSLLGMLRFLLLRNSPYFDGEKITDGDGAKELIGETSFTVKQGHGENDFKSIQSISGCFLQWKEEGRDWTNLSFSPFDSCLQVENPGKTGLYNGVRKAIPELKGYEAKDGYTKYVGSGETHIPISDIFVKDTRLGINCDIHTGKTQNDALFKQISYRLTDKRKIGSGKEVSEKPCQFRFAFTAKVDDGKKDWKLTDFSGQLVSVGGDNSQFIVGITTPEKQPEASKPRENAYKQVIVLQSPAYLLKEEVDNACFAITEIVPFRFLETSVKLTSYNILNKNITRSVRYQLYERGSVFYFSGPEAKNDFVKALDGKEEFVQIGYNRYSELVNEDNKQ